jgi:hypothetical protein
LLLVQYRPRKEAPIIMSTHTSLVSRVSSGLAAALADIQAANRRQAERQHVAVGHRSRTRA